MQENRNNPNSVKQWAIKLYFRCCPSQLWFRLAVGTQWGAKLTPKYFLTSFCCSWNYRIMQTRQRSQITKSIWCQLMAQRLSSSYCANNQPMTDFLLVQSEAAISFRGRWEAVANCKQPHCNQIKLAYIFNTMTGISSGGRQLFRTNKECLDLLTFYLCLHWILLKYSWRSINTLKHETIICLYMYSYIFKYFKLSHFMLKSNQNVLKSLRIASVRQQFSDGSKV